MAVGDQHPVDRQVAQSIERGEERLDVPCSGRRQNAKPPVVADEELRDDQRAFRRNVKRDLTFIHPSRNEGLDYELCFGSSDQHKVSLVWDSKEQLDAFAARLMPILGEFGIDPGEPEVFEVHNIIKR